MAFLVSRLPESGRKVAWGGWVGGCGNREDVAGPMREDIEDTEIMENIEDTEDTTDVGDTE